MALIIFKYCLPALLGYILFVGISGQLMPFRKPAELVERPAWLLGLWTSLAVFLVLSVGLHMAYQLNLSEVQQLMKPSVLLLAGVLAPGLIAYFMYSRAVRQELDAQDAQIFTEYQAARAASESDVELVDFKEFDSHEVAELEKLFDDVDNYAEIADPGIELPAVEDESFADEFAEQFNAADAKFEGHENSIVVDRIPAEDEINLVSGIEHMSWTETSDALPANTDTNVTGIEHMHWSQKQFEAAASTTPSSQEAVELVTGIEHMYRPELIATEHQLEKSQATHLNLTAKPRAAEVVAAAEAAAAAKEAAALEVVAAAEAAAAAKEAAAAEVVAAAEAAAAEKVAAVEIAAAEAIAESEAAATQAITESKAAVEAVEAAQAAAAQAAQAVADAESEALRIEAERNKEAERSSQLAVEIETVRRSLDTEVALHEETQKHLRATRRGLSALESENHNFELQKADVVIAAEQKLEAQIKRTSSSEAHAARVEKQKKALESQLLELKNTVLEAKQEIRQNTEARAKALNMANKSVAFSQKVIKERAALAEQLKDSEHALEKRQETVSSLITALEKEKSRKQSEIVSMAKQLVLHEKQLQARRSIELASRTTDGKVNTRLVKKVAKAANKSAA